MFEKINSIHEKTGKSKIYLLYDMQRCARKYGAGYMDYDLFEMYNLTPPGCFVTNPARFFRNFIVNEFVLEQHWSTSEQRILFLWIQL